MNSISEEKRSQDSATRKRSYEKPGIITFGSVAKLTQGMNGSHNDVGQNNSTRLGGH